MVRLKKKRFVVLDYTILPTETDIATASTVAHMEIPSGAGKQKCINKECTKVSRRVSSCVLSYSRMQALLDLHVTVP